VKSRTLHDDTRQESTVDPADAAELLAELATAASIEDLRPTAKKSPAEALGLSRAGLRCRRPVLRRIFRDDRAAHQAASELLKPLPETSETLHMILPGTFTPLDLVPALLAIIGQKAKSLRLATLGFSVQNVETLCRLLDEKTIRNLSVVCSRYFAAASKEIFAVAERELPRRGAKLVASRSHAKIMLIEAGKDRWTFEGSGNARSCVCIEQIALANDPQLFRFHAAWFDHVLKQEITCQ
jgi:hypothetical protein